MTSMSVPSPRIPIAHVCESCRAGDVDAAGADEPERRGPAVELLALLSPTARWRRDRQLASNAAARSASHAPCWRRSSLFRSTVMEARTRSLGSARQFADHVLDVVDDIAVVAGAAHHRVQPVRRACECWSSPSSESSPAKPRIRVG